MSSPDAERDSSAGHAIIALAVAMTCALAIHLPVSLGSGFGEPDSALLVHDALLWVRGGIRTNALSEYRYYSSPGYIWLITLLLPATPNGIARTATLLNQVNLIGSVLILIPLYLVTRRLGGHRAATVAVLLVSFLPTFFQGGLYGFPTLLAEFFLLWAIWLFDLWVAPEQPSHRSPWALAAVTCCLTVSVSLKVDVYIGAIALWGLLVLRRRFTWTNSIALAVAGAIPVAVLIIWVKALLVQSPDAPAYANSWNTKFPVGLRSQLTARHILQVFKSFGLLTIPVFLVSLAWLSRRRALLAGMLAVWAALPIAFWFFRAGDSARHHFPSSIPIAVGVAILIAALPAGPVVRWGALAALVLSNYFAFPASSSTLTVSGRLVESGRLLADFVGDQERTARAFGDLTIPRAVFVGTWRRIWYVDSEVLARADTILSYRWTERQGLPVIDISYLRAGTPFSAQLVASNGKSPMQVGAAADTYVGEGYRVFAAPADSTFGRRLPAHAAGLVEYSPPTVPAAAPPRVVRP